MSGCDRVSEGCGDPLALEPRPRGSGCYAEALAERMRGTAAFPVGFDTVFKPWMLRKPRSKAWRPGRIFVNSMSDLFHRDFTHDQIAQVFAVMLEERRHDYLILTKRPERMRAMIDRWLVETELDQVPEHIWLGTSIELAKYRHRADVLRDIPVAVRFISFEPLLGPIDRHDAEDPAQRWDFDLTGISWAIVGGESGPGYRAMDHTWAHHIRDLCRQQGTAASRSARQRWHDYDRGRAWRDAVGYGVIEARVVE